jgi:formylglycine-generating enzyme required for sulfatase activity
VPGGTYNRINDVTYPATVSSFRLDTYEITVGRFRKFVGAYSQNMIAAGAGKNPNNPSDPGWDSSWNASLPSDAAALRTVVNCHATYQTWSDSPSGGESRPMNCMTWHAAEAFCTWDGGRLPTEAEWNYAAAGGNEQRRYPWGNTEPGLDAKLAVYDCRYNGTGPCSGITNIASVGSVSAGNGKWGHSDMAGNVWEWVQDGYASPMAAACTNCADLTDSSFRVYRGGGFHQRASFLLVSYRDYYAPKVRSYPFGARCARTP